eukprot:gene3976-5697_t
MDDESVSSKSINIETVEDINSLLLLNGRKTRYLCFCLPYDWILNDENTRSSIDESKRIKNSSLSTFFLLLNTMIGSGILVQAYVMRESGVVAATIEYIVIGLMIYAGVAILIRVAEKRAVYDYTELMNDIFGPYGGLSIDLAIIVNNFGALLSYILIIGTLLNSVITTFIDCHSFACHPAFLTFIVVFLLVTPLCLIRRFGHLAIISYMSIFVISASMILVIIGGPIHAADNNYYINDDNSKNNKVLIGSFIGSIKNAGSIIFALGYATAIFHAYIALETKTIPLFTNILFQTTVAGVIMCFVTGLVGYLSFRDSTNANILENFPSAVGAIFKIALIIHLMLYIPGDFIIMRSSIMKLFKTSVTNLSNILFITSTLSIIWTVTLVAVIIQLASTSDASLAVVVDITGSVAGSITYFILPGHAGMI